MNKNNNLPNRKNTRLKDFNYNSIGAYFITLCVEDRYQVLSKIVGGDVLDAPKNIELLPYGIIADKYINQLNDYYDNIEVKSYAIMPNHIHIMLLVCDNGASGTSPPTRQHTTVSHFVSTFKRFCNKEYGEAIWQRGFYDHIIRNREDYEKHLRYINENSARWFYDKLFEKK